MNFFFRNQNGVSIVQGLILAGVIAGTSLVTTRLLTDQKLAQKGAQTRDQIEEFHNTISTVLQNRLNCYETMLKNSLQVTLKNSASSHTLTQIWTKDTQVAQTGSLYVNNGVLLKSLSLQAPNGGFRNLEINYERLNTGKGIQTGFGGKNIKKMISLRIQKDPTTSDFSSCYAVSGGQTQLNSTNSSEGNDISKQMCQEMYSGTGQKAFIWDEENSICKPNAQCPATQIYVGINSSGEVQCKNIEDWMDFNQVIDTTAKSCPAGSKVAFKIDSVNKKVSINCTITAATPTPTATATATPTPTPTATATATPTPTPTATVSPTPPLPAIWKHKQDKSSTCTASCSHIELPTCTQQIKDSGNRLRDRTTCRTGASGCSSILQEVKEYECNP